jgi:acetolactate synthase II small subunit
VSQRLTINFAPAEGAVLRMLGLVERRGYAVRGLTMEQKDDQGLLVMDVDPRDPGRRIDVVAQQLRRLIDVHCVTLASRDSGSAQ